MSDRVLDNGSARQKKMEPLYVSGEAPAPLNYDAADEGALQCI